MYGLDMADVTPAAQSMWAEDQASTAAGIQVDRAVAGESIVRLAVEPRHCNGLGVCHGGLIFTLADTAMALATNAGPDDSLATNAEIDFVAAARPGDVLTARCRRIVQRGKASVNDVEVVNQLGDTVAVFRGRTLTVGSSNGATAE